MRLKGAKVFIVEPDGELLIRGRLGLLFFELVDPEVFSASDEGQGVLDEGLKGVRIGSFGGLGVFSVELLFDLEGTLDEGKRVTVSGRLPTAARRRHETQRRPWFGPFVAWPSSSC